MPKLPHRPNDVNAEHSRVRFYVKDRLAQNSRELLGDS
jgi:hypothetical protein